MHAPENTLIRGRTRPLIRHWQADEYIRFILTERNAATMEYTRISVKNQSNISYISAKTGFCVHIV